MTEATVDIWSCVDDVAAICITTNGASTKAGRGIMGRGIALEATKLFPKLDLPGRLGQGLATRGNHVGILSTPSMRPELVAFPVKHHWQEPADPALIRRSAEELIALTNDRKWHRVALPRPGCGAGRLTWDDVKPLLVDLLDDRFVVVTK